MKYIPRIIRAKLEKVLERNKSVLLLGPRQTGKTTLLSTIENDLSISFVRPDVRQRYEKNPELLIGEVEALEPVKKRKLIFLDEVQKVPMILDVVQDLIDRKVASFILTGSSARKLRRGPSVNLLPGRIVTLRLDPFTLGEIEADLNNLLLYGSLPGIFAQKEIDDKEQDLESYVTTYLEEEIRAEAIVRNIGAFARFLECAAIESGKIVNLRKISQDVGVAHTTIASYYEVLEDCLISERVDPITKSSTRKKLTKSSKYLMFDLGVRRVSAREGTKLPIEYMGHLFEQWVGLELLRNIRVSGSNYKLKFWRDPDGPEVDWVLESRSSYIPIEVKWTDTPGKGDIRHLKVFQSEYKTSGSAYLVCRVPRKVKLVNKIFAIPWNKVNEIVIET